MEIKDILKSVRKTFKISQSELAKGIGIGQATVCQWELGHSKPTCDALIALSKYYGLSADFLLGINDDMHGGGLSDEHDQLIAMFDNLTHEQRSLIVGIMQQMKDI